MDSIIIFVDLHLAPGDAKYKPAEIRFANEE